MKQVLQEGFQKKKCTAIIGDDNPRHVTVLKAFQDGSWKAQKRIPE